MIADVVIVRDEGVDLPFKIAGQIVVVEQDAALQGLVPTLDLALGLRVIRRPRTCSIPLSSSHLARSPAT